MRCCSLLVLPCGALSLSHSTFGTCTICQNLQYKPSTCTTHCTALPRGISWATTTYLTPILGALSRTFGCHAAKCITTVCTQDPVLSSMCGSVTKTVSKNVPQTCSVAPDRMARLMSRIDLKCGAHSGHSFSFSPKLRRLKEWPHTKWTAGSSNGAPLSAHLLF